VSGQLTAEAQVNALVKQGNALSTVGYLALPVSSIGETKRCTEALLRRGVVGAGGVEPPSSSVSANHWEPLCYPPFSQVGSDRRCRRETLS
jgi:hypothetical protein